MRFSACIKSAWEKWNQTIRMEKRNLRAKRGWWKHLHGSPAFSHSMFISQAVISKAEARFIKWNWARNFPAHLHRQKVGRKMKASDLGVAGQHALWAATKLGTQLRGGAPHTCADYIVEIIMKAFGASHFPSLLWELSGSRAAIVPLVLRESLLARKENPSLKYSRSL